MSKASGGRYDRSPFPKRSKTLLRKASEIAEVSDADVYLLLVYRNEAWEYKSSADPSWPPTRESLEEHYSKVNRIPKDLKLPGPNIDHERLEHLQKYWTRRAELYGSQPTEVDTVEVKSLEQRSKPK